MRPTFTPGAPLTKISSCLQPIRYYLAGYSRKRDHIAIAIWLEWHNTSSRPFYLLPLLRGKRSGNSWKDFWQNQSGCSGHVVAFARLMILAGKCLDLLSFWSAGLGSAQTLCKRHCLSRGRMFPHTSLIVHWITNYFDLSYTPKAECV